MAGDYDGVEDEIEFDAEDLDMEDFIDDNDDDEDDEERRLTLMGAAGMLLAPGGLPSRGQADEGGGEGERLSIVDVGHIIEEQSFHRIELSQAVFFIRRPPPLLPPPAAVMVQDGRFPRSTSSSSSRQRGGTQQKDLGLEEDDSDAIGDDDDLYDFSEVYVSAPNSEVYSSPLINGPIPSQVVRCSRGQWKYLTGKMLPPSSDPYAEQAVEIQEVTKVFLIRHWQDRPTSADDFVLDFEEIYVLNGENKSISRANVVLELEEGKPRNRRREVLVVRDDGNSFKIIPQAKRKSPDEILEELHWRRTKEAMENYLRTFRDYEQSNWF
eukprot:TRINITY_DN2399_c0_g1_i1.p1 TRINITY_DN2399_c0_g1~~TRINITY_DN2399_c0_g1_i1.p1  ORF type:complete len:325 (+),score=88.48 TRINITY_DN2399_c0_g1_i1:2-976(+)